MDKPESPTGSEEVVLLECNLDDMTPEELGYALERVLEEGALDAWFTSIHAKKNRPAVVLSVLCRPQGADALRNWLLRHTMTLGVRWSTLSREAAERELVEVETQWGAVRCKIKRLNGRRIGGKPEYEDCAAIARRLAVPLRAVLGEAQHALDDLLAT